MDIALAQYAQGVIDLTRVTLLQQNLVGLEDTLAQAQGEIATGLIQVYRALGGGWEIRLAGCNPGPLPSPARRPRRAASAARRRRRRLPAQVNIMPHRRLSLCERSRAFAGANNGKHFCAMLALSETAYARS